MRQTIQHLRGTDTLDITKAKSAKMLLGEIAVKNGSGGTSELYVLSSDGNSLDTFVNKNYIDSKIDELSVLGSDFINGGVINITRSGSIESVFDELPNGGVSICIIGDSSGSYPSNPSNGDTEIRVNVNSKYNILDNYFFSENSIGANVGDILVINKQVVSGAEKCILKIIPLSDAKAPTETYAGTNGVFTYDDKQKLSKIDEIESLSIENADQIEENANVTSSALNDLNDRLNEKQDILVDGETIKTINGESILGEGDIEINASDIKLSDDYKTIDSYEGNIELTPISNEQTIDSAFSTIEGNLSDLAKKVAKNELVSANALTNLDTRVNNKQDILVNGENIKTINGESILGEGDIEINASTLGLSFALKYCGITTTELNDGSTTSIVTINGSEHSAETGCVVFYEDKEYVFNGSIWNELGYPTDLSSKQDVINDLEEIRNNSLSGATAYNSLENYYTKTIIDGEFNSVKNTIKENENVTASALNELKGQITDIDNNLTTSIDILSEVKQDVLVSGENIKTINGESILGEGNIELVTDLSDYYKKSEVDTEFDTVKTIIRENENVTASALNELDERVSIKQDMLVNGENIKTINGVSILGEGNIEINVEVDLSAYYDKTESDSLFTTKEYISELESFINESERVTSLSLNDLNKRVNDKIDKEEGKQLSDENFTSELKEKLESLNINAKDNVQSDWDETDNNSDAFILNKPDALKNPSSLKFGNKTYDGSNEVEITVSDLGLSHALKYCGITTTELNEGATASTITINGSEHVAEIGCVVFYEDKEYVFNGSIWNELGYPTDLSSKQDVINDLEEIRNNSLSGATAYNSLENYYTKTIIDGEFNSVKNTIKENENVTASALNELKDRIDETDTTVSESINILSEVKQDILVPGENIKTINGESILGEGNLELVTDLSDYYKKSEVDSKLDVVNEMVKDDEMVIANSLNKINNRLNSIENDYVNNTKLNEKFKSYYNKDEVDGNFITRSEFDELYNEMLDNEYAIAVAINDLNEKITNINLLIEQIINK